MELRVVNYGHPVLRQKGAAIKSVDTPVRRLIADMFETMQKAHGIGLAAQQVGQALQLAVIDIREVTDRPSQLWLNGEPAQPETLMPLVLINPVVTPAGDPATGPEGCLSFPELYADITRPDVVEVSALDAKGKPLSFRCSGLLARVVQHETDHLHGILFIDRMTRKTKAELKPELDALMAKTKQELGIG